LVLSSNLRRPIFFEGSVASAAEPSFCLRSAHPTEDQLKQGKAQQAKASQQGQGWCQWQGPKPTKLIDLWG
jgi:hypothetical protein